MPGTAGTRIIQWFVSLAVVGLVVAGTVAAATSQSSTYGVFPVGLSVGLSRGYAGGLTFGLSGSSSENGSVGSGSAVAAALVRAAAAHSLRAGSVTFTFRTSSRENTPSETVQFETSGRGEQNLHTLAVNVSYQSEEFVNNRRSFGVAITQRIVGARDYSGGPWASCQHGYACRQWVLERGTSLAEAERITGTLSSNVAVVLESLRANGAVVDPGGSTKVQGVECTTYHAYVSVSSLVSSISGGRIPASIRSVIATLYGGAPIFEYQVAVGDRDDRVHEVSFSLLPGTFPTGSIQGLSTEYFSYSARPITIVSPPKRDVVVESL